MLDFFVACRSCVSTRDRRTWLEAKKFLFYQFHFYLHKLIWGIFFFNKLSVLYLTKKAIKLTESLFNHEGECGIMVGVACWKRVDDPTRRRNDAHELQNCLLSVCRSTVKRRHQSQPKEEEEEETDE